MIVGCTAIVAPIPVGKGTLSKEIPLCVLAALMLFVCANDILLDGSPANVISRTDGLVLLGFFAIFMGYTFAIAKNGDGEEEGEIKSFPVWKSSLFILLGLGALIGGGQLFVNGASGIARSLGVSESIIGLTLVAGGTSLPELATSVSAALKKNPGIAIGNVIGSNLFNAFAVLGASATINDLPLGGITNFDFMTLITASVLLWVAGFFVGKRTITRPEGIFLVLCYVGYTTYLIMQQ
jgi:cation:H+ antiporter